MPGPWKAWKTKDEFPTLSTVPWKSRRKREIPTFPPPGFAAMGKWKTNGRFPTFPQPLARMTSVVSLKTKNQRKEVGRYAASAFPYTFSLRSHGTDFMLILQLENATVSRQNEKFLIGQSRKFLLTAERLGYGTNRDEPRGTRLVGMVKAGPRRDGDTAKRGRGHGCERAVGTQAAGQNGNARRWGGGSRVEIV